MSTSVLVEVGKTFWFWLVLHRRPLFLSARCLLFHQSVSFFAHHRRARAAHEPVQTLLVAPPPSFGDRCRMQRERALLLQRSTPQAGALRVPLAVPIMQPSSTWHACAHVAQIRTGSSLGPVGTFPLAHRVDPVDHRA